ncbi:amino acid adenylation domain-containing protein [Pseudomonas tussilaginis]
MQSKALSDLIERFIKLPTAQRKTLYQQMVSKGVNIARLPIPTTREAFEHVPLSFAQERQWFLWGLDPSSSAYNLPTALRLRGTLDTQALQASFDALVARHESLRTRFVEKDEQRLQLIDPMGCIAIEQLPLPLAPTAEAEQLQAYIAEQIARPFDLHNGPLLRVQLLRLAADDHVLLLVQHHIVSDAWSMQVMVKELVTGYSAYLAGHSSPLPELPIQYADYALWQRHWLEAGGREEQLAYWTEQLGDEQPVLQLPARRPRPALRSDRGGRYKVALEASLGQALKALAKQQGVTLFMLMLASFQALLQRCSGQDDIRVGVPIANRNRVETEGLIGFFVNTQVMRAQIDAQQSFSELLQQVKQRALGAQAHQDLPFEQLVDALQPERSMSHNPLFQVVYNHLSAAPSDTEAASQVQGLTVEAIEWANQTAQFDLALNTYESEQGLWASFIYACDLFDEQDARLLAGHWLNLLRAIVRDPHQRLGELELLGEAQQHATLAQWNPAPRSFAVEHCLHQLIEQQAARRPNAIALTHAGQHLNYDQLNRRANRLAHQLIAQGIGPDQLVGLACERSFDMLVGILAILKAGGAYVPLDPQYPDDRLAYMIEDSGIVLLLGQSAVLERLPVPPGLATFTLDGAAAGLPDSNPDVTVHPDNLAYVIYTSGSTGRPKGTLLPHRNVLRLFDATQDWFGFDHNDVWSLFHSYAFDFSVWEIFGALLKGGRLLIVPQDITRSPDDFYRLLCDEDVSVLNQTPSAFRQLMHVACAAQNQQRDNRLRHVVFGGEALDVGSLAPWFQRFGDQAPRLVNMYGITETTVHVTYRPLSLADLEQANVSPIGEPIPDLSWYLLDAQLNPVPHNCIGELYVGRAGLARGYLKRADLSATRFIPNPFDNDGSRLYRTGDLAHFGADGVIEYIGRIDHQVKIRGFRIELGEIETRLQALEGIRDAVVLAPNSATGPHLVAYVVPEGVRPDIAQLKARLKAALPDYMVPAHVLLLDNLPLTTNGKLDRKALPAPDASLAQRDYVAPRSALEQQIAAIWQAVLHVERVGLADNFFELGGHSLLATQVRSRIRQQLGIDVALRTLFEHNSLEALCLALGQTAVNEHPALSRVDRSQPLPLSYAQERQWFLWQLQPESAAYHIPAALKLRGKLDLAALQTAFNQVLARHESLRTRFVESDGQALQHIAEPEPFHLEVQSLASGADQELRIRDYVKVQVQRPFDLREGPLLRVNLLQVSDDEHVLLLVQHHIVSDAWSMQVMVEELVQHYRACSQGLQADLPPLAIQYADYAVWQRQWMAVGERERQLDYWTAQLAGAQGVLELPADHPRPATLSARGGRVDLQLDEGLVEQLRQLAQAQEVTLFMLLLASFQTLLHRYSGQDDIRVGVPIANRDRLETERLIGFFVNTQVLKADFSTHRSFLELLQHAKEAALGAQQHQELPFEQLVEALQPERSLSHNPLFQAMYNHQSTTRQAEPLTLPGLTVEALEWDAGTAQLDLTLETQDSGHGLSAALIYASDLFEHRSIERMARHWLNLLQGIVADPQATIAGLPLLDGEEQRQIVAQWNATAATYPLDTPVHRLIEQQVRATPDAPALCMGEQQLSYRELDQRANQLAHQLIALGVGPEVLVGIAVERSLEMVIGLLAILKAGGAYVPLDPEYPEERLAYMIEDSCIALLLTQSHLRLPCPAELPVLALDRLALEDFPVHAPALTLDPEQLAYVIYTSGSTGKPKGAGNRHKALTNRLCWMQQAYGLGAGDTVLQKTPFSFDVSVWEFFWPLMTGARLAMAGPGDHRDPRRLVELIHAHQVTTLHFVPSMLQMFLLDEQVTGCTGLRRIICSGEALPVDAQTQVLAKLPTAGLYNLYGPTEAAIDVTHWTCREEGRDSVPIGLPIANLQTYVLDAELQAVPVGVVGELYLGGTGLARGYHRRPALTAERFVTSPFGQGERLYRTGDLASQRADGVIDYRGRIDHQVKIRGLRIELGEIEARLMEQDAVREAVVLAIEGALVAYVVPGEWAPDAQEVLREAIREPLRQTLPDYMVPAQLLFIEQMPLSPNGKLERKALPKPDANRVQKAYVAPRTALEQQIAAIWQDVLKVAQIGLADNFFELGGDSIISIQVVSRARQAGIRFTPKDLFQHQTVRDLASVASLDEGLLAIDQAPASGVTPLLPIQHKFFAEVSQERHHWNQSVLLKPSSPLQAQALEQALQALVHQHDALRLVFSDTDDGWQARFLDRQARPLLEQQPATLATLSDLANQTQRSLDLQHGPLLRAVLLTLEDHSQRLLLVIHHLVVDGVSWRILFEDLQSAYTQALTEQPLQLPGRTTSVKTWAERLEQHVQSGGLDHELGYWAAQLDGVNTDLPVDHPRGSLQNKHAQGLQLRLDKHTTRRLIQEAPLAYRTQINDLLLTALARVIARWTERPQVAIQLEGHGREALFDDVDLTRTVGWFTSLFPVLLTTHEDPGVSLRGIKEQLRAVPAKGVGYAVLRHLGNGLAGLPEPRITFNYLGQFDSSFDADEGALFAPAAEGSGQEQSPHAQLGNWLTLNGQIFDGELSMNWLFSQQMFEQATVQALADDYQRELEALIAHCCDPRNRGFTPSDFPLARLQQAQLHALPVAAERIEDIYPLSPMQQGMLFHTLEAGEAGLYINQMAVPVEGLDIARFSAAWNTVIARHDILRTGFWSDSQLAEPLQLVYRQVQMPVTVLDWRDRQVEPQALAQLSAADYAKGFDLLQAPLMRLTLVQLDEQRVHLLWSGHHILVDGWSNSRLLGEVLQAYDGLPSTPGAGRYRDYIQWLAQQPQVTLEQFWRGKLSGFDSPTHLASSLAPRPDPTLQGHAALYLEWDPAQTVRLRELAQSLRVTPNTLIQATWLLLLQRYTGQASVCFGATVAGRPASLPGADEMLGLFINTLPVIQSPQPATSLQDWLLELQAYNLDIRDHEHASLADIQRWAGLGGQALFDSIIVFENYPIDERLREAGQGQLQFGEVQGRDVTNFAMDLAVNLGTTLSIEFLYLRNRFTGEAVEQIRASFEGLLLAMLDAPTTQLGNLSLLNTAQRQRLQHDNRLNVTRTHAPLLAEQLRQQAEARPDVVAVVCNDQQMTWAELESQANRLAHYLIAQGVGPEMRVGIALERSLQVVVAFYAVMKAGAAYVPLDIDYPQERLQWIVEDSGMSLMISQDSLRPRFDWPGAAPLIAIDQLALDQMPSRCPAQRTLGDNLAYLIYTSGSTGKPKGVAVANEPLRMHCQAIAQRYEMSRDSRELLFMSFAFDGAQERWLTTLSCGGQLVLRDNRLWTPEETWQALHAHRISVACFPPAYLQQLAEFAQSQDQPPPPVSIYCFGGDAVAEANFELVKQALRPTWLTNGYGPTETVVTPLLWKVPASGHCDAVYAPIGSRVGERTLYVLDDALNPVPPGVAGELYIGGQGVARGYHQRPGLTAERFVADPFQADGTRLYRSGDLVRQRADGTFDYLGRLDNQVKIRGFRIELGEIESRLRGMTQVQDAVVVAREHNSGKQLIGYVVAEADEGLGERLRSALLEEMPDYMVPAQILTLVSFPLNPNGKLDRNALPDPDFKGRVFIAPRNALEQALAQIWQEVLELEQVGVTDNFFELGGDSLRILKVLSKVRGQPELGLQLKLRDLMGKPTIAELSGYQGEERNLNPLLLLNASVPAHTPLFCLHAGFGTVFDYEALARRLDGRCSVYGLQCRMLLDDDWQDESLQAMAIDYAQYIRQKQPQGPYHLLGWSLGGPLATLVADELIKQGQPVDFVALVDSFTPEADAPLAAEDCCEDLRGLLSVVLGVPSTAVPRVVVDQDAGLAQLQQVIDQARQGLTQAAGALREIGSDELARTFLTGMKLKALAARLAQMPRCVSNSHCWWAGANNVAQAAAFADSRQHAPIDTDHYAILRHPTFIEGLLEHLPQSEPVTP